MEIRVGLLDFEFHFLHGVVVVDLGGLELGARLPHSPGGFEPVENIPRAGDAVEPAIHDAVEFVAEAGGAKLVTRAGVEARLVAGERHFDLLFGDEDLLPLHFEKGALFPCELEGLHEAQRALDDLELAGAMEGGLAIGAGIEAERFRELELGDEVAVPRADQVGTGVGEFDFGAEHVETRDGAGVETVLLILELVAEELDGLLLHGDERVGEEDVVKLRAGLRDDPIDGVAQLEVAAVLGEFGDLDSRAHLAARIQDLLGGDAHRPGFVAGAEAVLLVESGSIFKGGSIGPAECRGGRAAAAPALDEARILVIETARRLDVRQGLRADFDDLAAGALDLLELLEDLGVLRERRLDRPIEREVAGDDMRGPCPLTRGGAGNQGCERHGERGEEAERFHRFGQ